MQTAKRRNVSRAKAAFLAKANFIVKYKIRIFARYRIAAGADVKITNALFRRKFLFLGCTQFQTLCRHILAEIVVLKPFYSTCPTITGVDSYEKEANKKHRLYF